MGTDAAAVPDDRMNKASAAYRDHRTAAVSFRGFDQIPEVRKPLSVLSKKELMHADNDPVMRKGPV